jgi:L-ascorbate metabolism protein UlaG (beta-lactamase superfamily)
MMDAPGTTPERGAGTDEPTLMFIGNATVLLRYAGFTVLTDPNFLHRGQRAYLGYGLTSRRRTEPALSVDALPALDAVVLSHLHGDHWDRVARRGLPRHLLIVTTPHASRRLQGLHRFRAAVGLRTWEHVDLAKDGATLRVTSLPGQHAPGRVRHLLPPVMGSMLEFTPAGGHDDRRFQLYITGDTLCFDGLAEIAVRWPAIDAAVLHLGGTRLPGGIMVTMDGRQGTDLLEAIRPPRAVPVHHSDYDVFSSPLSDFLDEARRRGLDKRIVRVEQGQTVTLPTAAHR